jgi:hypothetical protein
VSGLFVRPAEKLGCFDGAVPALRRIEDHPLSGKGCTPVRVVVMLRDGIIERDALFGIFAIDVIIY